MFIDDIDMTVYTAITVPIERIGKDEDSQVSSLTTLYGNENRFKFIRTLSTKTSSVGDQSQPSGADEMSPILLGGRSVKMSTPKGLKKLMSSPVNLKVKFSSPCQLLGDDPEAETESMYRPIRFKSQCSIEHEDFELSEAQIEEIHDSKLEAVNETCRTPDPQFLSMQYRDKSSRILANDLQAGNAYSVNGDLDADEPIDTVVDHLAALKNDGAFMDYMQNKRLEAEKVVPDLMTPIRRRLSSVYLVSMPHKTHNQNVYR